MLPLLLVLLIAVADPKGLPAPRRLPLTNEQADFIVKGVNKVTTEQLFAQLGPADRYEHADLTSSARTIADVQVRWVDELIIDIRYKDNNLVSVTAQYGGYPPLTTYLPEQVLRLKPGMASRDVQKALGTRSSVMDRALRRNLLGADIKKGQLTGYRVAGSMNWPKTDKAGLPAVKCPPLTKELAAGVKKGTAVADVLKQLGRPDRIELPHDGSRGPKDTTVLTWHEITEIDAAFQKEKTVRLVGRFHPNLSHEKVTAANFVKLNHGYTPDGGKTLKEVKDLLGDPIGETKDKDGLTIRRYGMRRTVEVFLDADGKVAATRFAREPKD